VSAKRLDGKAVAQERREALAERVRLCAQRSRPPALAVVTATEDDAALAYLRSKARLGEKLGIRVEQITIPSPTTESLRRRVIELGNDPSFDGILIETPVAEGIELRALQSAVVPEKDVDGAGSVALGRLFEGRPTFVPATAAAVMALLDAYEISIDRRDTVVVGRSLTVGRPLAQLLLARGATVTVCHSHTADLAAHTRSAELLCVAVGRARFVTAEMVRPGAVVIDVGTNPVDGGLVGDVDEDAASVASALSPVPGGVGPLTTLLLLENVVRAAEGSAG
jgi:methylenetetrahydrofolate dehydrogenase (NADP+)/methenyltetrahydrofolate cyclohydrolase